MRSIRDIAPARFRFLTAAEWGMTWKRPAVPEKLNDPEVYVHHTAGSRMSTDATEAFRLLNRYAQESKGYSALDYDILVHRAPDGLVTIGAGRSEWMSAATRDRNEQGEAVCVMGYFHPGHSLTERPHADEVEGTALAIVWGIQQGWIARDAVIRGHFENPAHPGATGCPGAYFIPQLPVVRQRVAFWLAACDEPEPPEEDDMSRVNAVIMRVKGTADHWVCFPLDKGTKERMAPDEPTPIVLDGDRREFARRAGYTLTPMPGE